MIIGIGIDILEIKRMDGMLKKKNFMERFYTPREREYLSNKGRGMAETAAGYFAGKEAVVKSLGTGFSGFKWQDVEIIKTDKGQPKVRLRGEAEIIAQKSGITDILLTISHSKEYAVAQAIAISEPIKE